jgi:hypothetical protein
MKLLTRIVKMKHFALVATLLGMTACTSTNFTRTGFDSPPVSISSGPIVVLEHFPTDRKYVEIGFCTTSVPGGGIIKDNTPNAIRELQECARRNGGNAIVFSGDGESGIHTGFGYSQQRVKARATVIYVFPKSE